MADCEKLPNCPFFHDKMEDMPGVSFIYKNRYCLGDNFACARHMVMREAGPEMVPADLFPNQTDRARDILAEVAHEAVGS